MSETAKRLTERGFVLAKPPARAANYEALFEIQP
jgi:hypothetical protein